MGLQLELYRQQIEVLFKKHPDHDLFGSLPGAKDVRHRGFWRPWAAIPSVMALTKCFNLLRGPRPSLTNQAN